MPPKFYIENFRISKNYKTGMNRNFYYKNMITKSFSCHVKRLKPDENCNTEGCKTISKNSKGNHEKSRYLPTAVESNQQRMLRKSRPAKSRIAANVRELCRGVGGREGQAIVYNSPSVMRLQEKSQKTDRLSLSFRPSLFYLAMVTAAQKTRNEKRQESNSRGELQRRKAEKTESRMKKKGRRKGCGESVVPEEARMRDFITVPSHNGRASNTKGCNTASKNSKGNHKIPRYLPTTAESDPAADAEEIEASEGAEQQRTSTLEEQKGGRTRASSESRVLQIKVLRNQCFVTIS
ncbi:hypothetical protein M9H77_22595 [Catharanthus roseus]|uniref:Uncharacterized protein n=1 Tax=Catharanthus roseus TaxID=4058 RepID=A0ACC0ATF8_CATRO|nr:hypothetical protein M9H77_22595 [Catharanthus roseus]